MGALSEYIVDLDLWTTWKHLSPNPKYSRSRSATHIRVTNRLFEGQGSQYTSPLPGCTAAELTQHWTEFLDGMHRFYFLHLGFILDLHSLSLLCNRWHVNSMQLSNEKYVIMRRSRIYSLTEQLHQRVPISRWETVVIRSMIQKVGVDAHRTVRQHEATACGNHSR